MSNALVILSGGQDSTTCLYVAKSKHDLIYAISFNYGQRHFCELFAAKKIASAAKVEYHEIIDVKSTLRGTSPLVDNSQEVQKYESVEAMLGGIENTFVPARNSLFLTIAMNRAVVLDCSHIYIGVSQVDYGGYPDCRSQYISSIANALNEGVFGSDRDKWIKIETPLIHLSKKDTVLLAASLSGCLTALSHSYTCYTGSPIPCMKCHSCLLRQKGFEEAGIEDPFFKRIKGEEIEHGL